MYYMAVCDDQIANADFIVGTLEKKMSSFGCPAQFEVYTDPRELRYEIGEGKHFDALFLDIDMPELDGLSLCRFIKLKLETCLIVFVSNQEQLVFQAIEVQPFRFIRKRYFREEVDKLARDVMAELGRREKMLIRLTDQSGKRAYAFDINKVFYIEAQGKKCRVVTEESKTELTTKLTDFQAIVSPFKFIKIHRSYLVNPMYIFRIERESVKLDNGEELPMSRNRADHVWEAFFSWSRRSE